MKQMYYKMKQMYLKDFEKYCQDNNIGKFVLCDTNQYSPCLHTGYCITFSDIVIDVAMNTITFTIGSNYFQIRDITIIEVENNIPSIGIVFNVKCKHYDFCDTDSFQIFGQRTVLK